MRLHVTFFAVWLTSLTLGYASEPLIVCEIEVTEVQRGDATTMRMSEIESTLCTHLIGAYIDITENGEVLFDDKLESVPDDGRYDDIKQLNALRKKNPRLNTLVSRRRFWKNFSHFAKLTADATLRSVYVRNVLDFVLRYGFDGFEIELKSDSHHTGRREDLRNYLLLLKEFRKAFDTHKLFLAAVVEWNGEFARYGYDNSELWEHPHFINLLTYNYHWGWDLTADHTAPLYPAYREKTEIARAKNVNATIHHWLNHGAPAEKIVLGITGYGALYKLKNPIDNVPGSEAIQRPELGNDNDVSEAMRFSEICTLTSRVYWTSVWDEEQGVPYAFYKNQWLSFDNVNSVSGKAHLAKALNLGGVMFSTLQSDDYLGQCGEKYPLLSAVNRVMRDAGSTDPDEGGKISCARYNSKYARHPQNCDKFWICRQIRGHDFAGEPFTCGGGLYFDTNKTSCRSIDLVDCS